jgi:TP901 family phage tail tape measure protein
MAIEVKLVIDEKGAIKQVEQFGKKVAPKLSKNIEKAGEKSGTKMADGFSKGFSSNLKSNLQNLAPAIVAADLLGDAIRGVGRAFKESIQNLREFGKGIAEINSLLPANAKLTTEAANSILSLSASYGSSQQSQARAFYDIVSGGIKGTSEQLRVLEQANKAAVAGLVDIDKSAKLLIQSMNSYAKTGLTAEQASDQLFAAVREGVTDFGQLSEFMGNVTGIAASVGLEFSELTGAVAAFTKVGLKTDVAVTGLRQVLVSLAKPTQEAKQTAQKLGIEFNTLALKTKGLAQFLKDIQIATKGNNDALPKLFGNVRALAPIMATLNGNFKDFKRILDETKKSAGATDAAFMELRDTLDFDLKQLDSSYESLSTTIGNVFEPALRAAARAGTGLLKVVSSVFKGRTEKDIDLIGEENIAKAKSELAELTGLVAEYNKKRAMGASLTRGEISDLARWEQSIRAIEGALASAGKRFTSLADIGRLGREPIEKQVAEEKERQLLLEQVRQDARATALENIGNFGISKEELLRREEAKQIEALDRAAQIMPEKVMEIEARKLQVQEDFAKRREKLQKKTTKTELNISAMLTSGISSSIQDVTNALVNGENAFEAFGKNILKMMGDFAIKTGEFFIAQGVAGLALQGANFPGVIAAGAGLIALGTVLKSFGGGGSESSAGGTGGAGGVVGTLEPGDTGIAEETEERDEPLTSITVNVEGDILGDDGTKLVTLINDAFDQSGAVIKGLNTV